jgi:hypothetical protein
MTAPPVRLQVCDRRNGVYRDSSRRMRRETVRTYTASIVGGVVNWFRRSPRPHVSQSNTPANVLWTGDILSQHPNTAADDPNLQAEPITRPGPRAFTPPGEAEEPSTTTPLTRRQ